MKIPFNKPLIIGKELEYITEAATKNIWLAGDGAFTHKCQKWLEQRLKCPKVLLTHSCTAALEMCAILCNIRPGDEIIMPSYTFVSTANAFVLRGGIPVFLDIRPDTLNIDETLIESALTEKTKAIVAVHYAGAACEMDRIMKIARKHRLLVIEDAAQALLSTYKKKQLGTIGDLGTVSFHETKNIISGEGGALFINNKRFNDRSEILREKGTNRTRFFRGEIDKYTWVDTGSSYLPSELTAAFLYAQLENADRIIARRCKLHALYHRLLSPLAEKTDLEIAGRNTTGMTNNGHLFYILVKDRQERTALIRHLKQAGIEATFHYVPLHTSPAGRKFARTAGRLPNTVRLSERILRLPLYYDMTEAQVQKVVDRIQRFYEK